MSDQAKRQVALTSAYRAVVEIASATVANASSASGKEIAFSVESIPRMFCLVD